MAIIQSPITGHMKKQAGGMVFSTVFGNKVMRSKPFQYRDKNSTAQQAVRSLFNHAVSLASMLKFYAVSLFENQPTGMSAYSKILSQLRSCFSFVGQTVTFKPAGKYIGNGSIPDARDVVVTNQTGGVIKIDWDDAVIYPDEKATDTVKILVISDKGDKMSLFSTAATRSNGTVNITLDDTWDLATGSAFFAYPIFTSAAGDKCSATLLSDSNTPVYIGS
jgi:hypothetical protein